MSRFYKVGSKWLYSGCKPDQNFPVDLTIKNLNGLRNTGKGQKYTCNGRDRSGYIYERIPQQNAARYSLYVTACNGDKHTLRNLTKAQIDFYKDPKIGKTYSVTFKSGAYYAVETGCQQIVGKDKIKVEIINCDGTKSTRTGVLRSNFHTEFPSSKWNHLQVGSSYFLYRVKLKNCQQQNPIDQRYTIVLYRCDKSTKRMENQNQATFDYWKKNDKYDGGTRGIGNTWAFKEINCPPPPPPPTVNPKKTEYTLHYTNCTTAKKELLPSDVLNWKSNHGWTQQGNNLYEKGYASSKCDKNNGGGAGGGSGGQSKDGCDWFDFQCHWDKTWKKTWEDMTAGIRPHLGKVVLIIGALILLPLILKIIIR